MEPIVMRDTVRAQARTAADDGKNVHRANPYPAGTEAAELFTDEFMRRHFELVRMRNFQEVAV